MIKKYFLIGIVNVLVVTTISAGNIFSYRPCIEVEIAHQAAIGNRTNQRGTGWMDLLKKHKNVIDINRPLGKDSEHTLLTLSNGYFRNNKKFCTYINKINRQNNG